MFTLDERIKSLPANRDAILLLYQSINSPQVGIPGRQAGPAQAFIVGMRGASGAGLFIYLYLVESHDAAVYVSDQRGMTLEQLQSEESEALGFVESMGFMMDNLNYANLSTEGRDELMRGLPVFHLKHPTQPTGLQKAAEETKKSPAMLLGRILSSF